ncbi:MAG: flagellar biosynthesis protein FlhF [Selenomonadales bacterium]|nr:flagellar biosynthesis protein FlhF [Selenomonadales bacterium]
MRIKKVVAKDMQIALHMLRKELGPEAVIVSSRTVREPGILGWFRPAKVEVTAAVERVAESRLEPDDALRSELMEIKAMLSGMGAASARTSAKGVTPARWAERFRLADLSPEVIALLCEQLGAGDKPAEEEKRVLERLAKCFSPYERPKGKRKRIQAFVGPTGVGKTTTIAKLAAQQALQEQKKVALITIDTFRIGAVEQLRVYGDIIGLPVAVVGAPSELGDALTEFKTKDAIFIDTTGRSARKPLHVSEMRAYFDGVPDLEKYLVLSSTTKSRDLLAIYKTYCELGLSAAIFTKCDETESLGGIVDLCYRTSIPVAYLTNGQNVPEDIREAHPQELARLVLGVTI